MKTPTAALQALIDTDTGTQPTYIVRIDWPTPKYYSMYLDAACDANPKEQLKNISSAALQVNASATANVDSIRAVLADTDGSLLIDYKTYGIKGRAAAVYLSYIGEDTADFLTIVDGKVTGDVTWDTDESSLYIEITTRFDDELIGHSTSTLANMHKDAKDKAWPLVFGSPLRVPALHIRKRPTAFLASGINQIVREIYLTDTEDFSIGTTIQIEIDSLRMTGSLTDSGTFTVSTMNDALHTGVFIGPRVTSDPSWDDPFVFWLAEDINIEGLFCYVVSGTTDQYEMVNYCVKQRGNKCIFARSWGVQRPWGSSMAIDTPDDYLMPLILSNETIDEVAAVPRASWPAGYRHHGQFEWPTFSFTKEAHKVIPSHDGWGWRVDREAFSIKGGSPVHQVVDYDDMYICNLATSHQLLEIWGEVDHEDVDMRPIPSSYYTFNGYHTLQMAAAGANAAMTVNDTLDLTVGNYFTLTDTSGSSVQFTFQNNNTYDGSKYSGDLIVGIADVNGDVGDVADRIKAVVNAQTDVDITAISPHTSADVILTQNATGAAGNTAISNAAVGLSSTDFTGGASASPLVASTYTDTQTCTTITMTTPLIARIGEKWTGKIWTTVRSDFSSNGVYALGHLIDLHSIKLQRTDPGRTTYTVDATTFNSVATKVNGWPVNFALLEEVPLISTLKEIAFQLRCGLIFRGSTILIKYISESINAQHSLTDAEIIDEGMIFNNDTSLTRATSLTAKWRLDYTGRKNYQRKNTYKNNTHIQLIEQEFNFYIYNIEALVRKTLAFWGYRFSNTWYSIELKAPLSSAVLEAFDIIGISTGDYSVHTVRGEVQKVNIDTTTNLVSIRTLMSSKPKNDSYVVVAIDQDKRIFHVPGDQTSVFKSGDSITITGSTGNDGTYTVNGTPVYDPLINTTSIRVVQAIPSPIADGYVVPASSVHPTEDPNLFTGDPSDPITYNPPIIDPSSGLGPATHLDPLPTDGMPGGGGGGDDGGGGGGNQFIITVVTQPPGTVERDKSFNWIVIITDIDDERINQWKTIAFRLIADDDDVISPVSLGSRIGEYIIPMTLTGGSGDFDGAQIEITANDAPTRLTDKFNIRDIALTTLRFDVHPTSVIRGTDFTVSVTGGGDGNTFDVTFSATDDIGDRLYDAAGLVTQVVVNSSGDFDTTTWQARDGHYNGQMTVTLTDPNDKYEPASFTCTLIGPLVTIVTHEVGFQQSKIEADAPDADIRKLVVTACPTSIAGSGPGWINPQLQGWVRPEIVYFTFSIELQDSNGDIDTEAMGYVYVTWSDLIGDKEIGSEQTVRAVPPRAINFGERDDYTQDDWGYGFNSNNRAQMGTDYTRLRLFEGAWSSSTNFIYDNPELSDTFGLLSDPITLRFEYWENSNDHGYYSHNTGVMGPTATCVSPKVSSAGTLEQIIYERQVCGNINEIDPTIGISIIDAKTAINQLALHYLKENDWEGGTDSPDVNSTGYADAASTREELANLALTCKYTVHYEGTADTYAEDPAGAGVGDTVEFAYTSEGYSGYGADALPEVSALEAKENFDAQWPGRYDYPVVEGTGQIKITYESSNPTSFQSRVFSFPDTIRHYRVSTSSPHHFQLYARKARYFAFATTPKYIYSLSTSYKDGGVYNRFGQEWLPENPNMWAMLYADIDWTTFSDDADEATTYSPSNVPVAGTLSHSNFANHSIWSADFHHSLPDGSTLWPDGDAPYDYDAAAVGWNLIKPTVITEWQFEYTSWDTSDT